jgi:pimeloyl-ACP methyl ester carboxylesterase
VEDFPDPGEPVLIAWGEHDRMFPSPRYTDAWRRAAPHAAWRVLRGVGHVPMIDDPELVAQTILEWCQQAH